MTACRAGVGTESAADTDEGICKPEMALTPQEAGDGPWRGVSRPLTPRGVSITTSPWEKEQEPRPGVAASARAIEEDEGPRALPLPSPPPAAIFLMAAVLLVFWHWCSRRVPQLSLGFLCCTRDGRPAPVKTNLFQKMPWI